VNVPLAFSTTEPLFGGVRRMKFNGLPSGSTSLVLTSPLTATSSAVVKKSSPATGGADSVTVIVTVALSHKPGPAHTLYVNESVPRKLLFGV
jgi:hypothetical protein